MPTFLLHGDTIRHPAIRHEVPLEILDPFLVVIRDDAVSVLTSSLEAARLRAALPGAELLLIDDLGYHELVEGGMTSDDAMLEVAVRALRRWAVDAAVVPGDLPVAVADRLRAAGIAVEVDAPTVAARRRVKTPAELDGIRRAQRAAEAGMAVAERLIRGAEARDGLLHHNGGPLTAERVRSDVRAACAAAGAPAPPDIMVVSAYSGGGHDPGSGPLPAGLPIEVDLWPRDEATGCWADMTRTFVCGGDPADDVLAWHGLCQTALERVVEMAAPGVPGRELFDAACDVFEEAGEPTQRTKPEGESLRDGFFHSLGHGVGLEVHEEPALGRTGADPLVPGDVVAVEPGCYRNGYGGVRLEDLLLITEGGAERLTDFRYELAP